MFEPGAILPTSPVELASSEALVIPVSAALTDLVTGAASSAAGRIPRFDISAEAAYIFSRTVAGCRTCTATVKLPRLPPAPNPRSTAAVLMRSSSSRPSGVDFLPVSLSPTQKVGEYTFLISAICLLLLPVKSTLLATKSVSRFAGVLEINPAL